MEFVFQMLAGLKCYKMAWIRCSVGLTYEASLSAYTHSVHGPTSGNVSCDGGMLPYFVTVYFVTVYFVTVY